MPKCDFFFLPTGSSSRRCTFSHAIVTLTKELTILWSHFSLCNSTVQHKCTPTNKQNLIKHIKINHSMLPMNNLTVRNIYAPPVFSHMMMIPVDPCSPVTVRDFIQSLYYIVLNIHKHIKFKSHRSGTPTYVFV